MSSVKNKSHCHYHFMGIAKNYFLSTGVHLVGISQAPLPAQPSSLSQR